MGYQTRLEDLESTSADLRLFNKDNVFQKYDEAVKAASQAGDDPAAAGKVESALNDIVSAVKDFTGKVNSVMSYLKNNSGISSGVSAQLDSLKRSLPSEKTLKAVGLSYDTDGSLKLDEDALKEAMQKDPDQVKELLGGQFGWAPRLLPYWILRWIRLWEGTHLPIRIPPIRPTTQPVPEAPAQAPAPARHPPLRILSSNLPILPGAALITLATITPYPC